MGRAPQAGPGRFGDTEGRAACFEQAFRALGERTFPMLIALLAVFATETQIEAAKPDPYPTQKPVPTQIQDVKLLAR